MSKEKCCCRNLTKNFFLNCVNRLFSVTHLVLSANYFMLFIADFCLLVFQFRIFISKLYFTQYQGYPSCVPVYMVRSAMNHLRISQCAESGPPDYSRRSYPKDMYVTFCHFLTKFAATGVHLVQHFLKACISLQNIVGLDLWKIVINCILIMVMKTPQWLTTEFSHWLFGQTNMTTRKNCIVKQIKLN